MWIRTHGILGNGWWCKGIFDLFHFGHSRALEQAKKVFPNVHLIVGCCSDKVTHSFKGKTVLTDKERYETLRHCRWVDEIITDAPWVVTKEFLDEHEIDFVAHDALPYADASGQADDVYGMVKKLDRFVETQRTDGISTSDLILRIIKNYNDYVMRNLARGYTRKDLGISYVKEKRVRAASQIRRLSQKVREQQERMGKNLAFLPKGLRQNSQFLQFIKHFSDHVEDLMDKFVAEFGHEMQKNAGSFHRNADRIMTGFFREVEEKYQNWEKRLTSRFGKRFSPRI